MHGKEGKNEGERADFGVWQPDSFHGIYFTGKRVWDYAACNRRRTGTHAGNRGILPENLALLRKLREKSKLPMLVAFQKSSDEIRIMALNAGADDCIGPDCSVLEALARIQAQIRCYSRLLAAHKQTRTIRLAGLEVDDSAKKVRVEGNDVRLTPTEYKILCLLLEQPGRVLSNRQIYEKIWKMAPIGADNVVAVHIRHIREKIEENPENPRYLKVVWGQGYKVG